MQSNAFEQAQLQAAARARQFRQACAARFSTADDEALRRALRLLQGALWAVMAASAVTLLMYNVVLWMARNP